MKILVLNGSPRANGNTAGMVKTFQQAAEEHGHQVTVFNVCKMNIKGCLACEYCHGKGHGQCVRKDDMRSEEHTSELQSLRLTTEYQDS